MEQEIEYEQFGAGQAQALAGEVDLSRVSDIPMELSVEIGRTQMTVGETLSLRAGTIVTLDRLAGEPVDLLVNGTPIARGEVVVVDEKFGLRVKEILEGGEASASPGDPAHAPSTAGEHPGGEPAGAGETAPSPASAGGQEQQPQAAVPAGEQPLAGQAVRTPVAAQAVQTPVAGRAGQMPVAAEA